MLFVAPPATTFNEPWLGYVLIPSIMPFLPKKKKLKSFGTEIVQDEPALPSQTWKVAELVANVLLKCRGL